MDIRYSAHPKDVARYTTEELRKEFLITGLYKADEVVCVYSHVDRMGTMALRVCSALMPSSSAADRLPSAMAIARASLLQWR